MSLNAISKHLFVLERAGLIRRKQNGNIQSCVLAAEPMASADEWLGHYRQFWNRKLDQLAQLVEEPKERP